MIKSKSTQAFKNYVKKKVKLYALKTLKMKQTNHKKMANVYYETLEMQSYFKSPKLKEADKRTIFKYRVRMEKFGENYRGGHNSIMCPLCFIHLDNQEMSFQCPDIKKEIEIKGDISDIYKTNIGQGTIETVLKITEYRKRRLENQMPTS